jgi:beta-glucosidase
LALVCLGLTLGLTAISVSCTGVSAPQAPRPWLEPTMPVLARAQALVDAMTLEEKLTLVMGYTEPYLLAQVPAEQVAPEVVADVIANQVRGSAGYVPGVPRLGLPPQWQTDASIGVRVQGMRRTALPSSLASAASFEPQITEASGAMIAREARLSGFNVFLAGGANLAREPRNGRNFEYSGEDPLLSGLMTAGLIRGIQSQHMVSTMKHFALNDQETQRTTLDVRISAPAMHQSDLLAFELIVERADPGSVMCSYNLLGGVWACESDQLLNQVLKGEWGYAGYVMSDWGAVHSTVAAAMGGLDQMTGFPCCGDGQPYFGAPLRAAVTSGAVPRAHLDEMALRIVRALIAKGALDDPPHPGPIDFEANAQVARHAAQRSLVLLKNDRALLPLEHVASLAVIGGHADRGVLSGGGSAGVTPVGGNAVAGLRRAGPLGPVIYVPSSPLEALRRALPAARIAYADGSSAADAARLAARSDVAIVFVTQWMTEGADGRLELQDAQDALVDAVAAANARTVVVVESGGAVFMPWIGRVSAVLEAFYPGARGAEALADLLTGRVNPSGHLPISFPGTPAQLAHDIAGMNLPDKSPVAITYDEGAAIGYKWYDLKGFRPLFAFGHGLSYTTFELSGLHARMDNDVLRVDLDVRNAGARAGAAVPQIYLAADAAAGWESRKRLGGFAKVDLSPGEQKHIELEVDPRLLAIYDEPQHAWRIAPGRYRILAGQASDALGLMADIDLAGRSFSARHRLPE